MSLYGIFTLHKSRRFYAKYNFLYTFVFKLNVKKPYPNHTAYSSSKKILKHNSSPVSSDGINNMNDITVL